jgi:hypothetical protein
MLLASRPVPEPSMRVTGSVSPLALLKDSPLLTALGWMASEWMSPEQELALPMGWKTREEWMKVWLPVWQ